MGSDTLARRRKLYSSIYPRCSQYLQMKLFFLRRIFEILSMDSVRALAPEIVVFILLLVERKDDSFEIFMPNERETKR